MTDQNALLQTNAGGDPGVAAAAAAAASAAATSTTGQDAAKPWFGDSTHKELITGKGFKSLDDVITWGKNAESLIGLDRAGRTVVLPKDANDVEGNKAFRARMGVPEKADDYALPVPDGQDPALSKEAAKWFHEAGVPAPAARAITEAWNKHIEAMVTADVDRQQRASVADLEKLKGEWGGEFENRAEFARRFLREAGWDEAKVAKYESAFGTAQMLRDFHGWGTKVGEHSFQQGQGGGGMTPQKKAVQTQIDELRQKRLANQINTNDFNAEMGRLGPLLEAAS